MRITFKILRYFHIKKQNITTLIRTTFAYCKHNFSDGPQRFLWRLCFLSFDRKFRFRRSVENENLWHSNIFEVVFAEREQAVFDTSPCWRSRKLSRSLSCKSRYITPLARRKLQMTVKTKNSKTQTWNCGFQPHQVKHLIADSLNRINKHLLTPGISTAQRQCGLCVYVIL